MKLIVGLGNPGRKYEMTRHNLGFMVVDKLAQDAGEGWRKSSRFSAQVAQWLDANEKIVLLKPETFMNLSGQAVSVALNWLGAAPADLLVVADDLDLELFKLRFRRSGSSGGHRGLESIEQQLATREFARLKIGIRTEGRGDAAGYVLDKFTAQEQPALSEAVERAAQAVKVFCRDGVDAAMQRFN